MINQVADAFERKDYRTAARLLKQLVQQEPKNPVVRLYVGRLHEATGKLEAAETVYRQLLRDTTNPKIMSQARQGLGRLEAMEQEQRRQAIAQATANPNSTELGVLVLESISSEVKASAAQRFARIMQLDAYSARLQLPSRGWRLYRTGPVGELQFYVSALQQAEIPCFAASVADIQKVNVFGVNYFSDGVRDSDALALAASGASNRRATQATVVCQNAQGQQGSLTFNWSEVTQRVEGLLPLFEDVVDLDARGRLERKTKTLDYVQFCDLHLPQRGSILRLCDRALRGADGDRNYQFQQGIDRSRQQPNSPQRKSQASPPNQSTTRTKWNNLLDFFNRQLPQTPVWSDFTTFAETAMDFKEMLGHLPSHINLFRREETLWDPAFQLYSGLVFVKDSSRQ